MDRCWPGAMPRRRAVRPRRRNRFDARARRSGMALHASAPAVRHADRSAALKGRRSVATTPAAMAPVWGRSSVARQRSIAQEQHGPVISAVPPECFAAMQGLMPTPAPSSALCPVRPVRSQMAWAVAPRARRERPVAMVWRAFHVWKALTLPGRAMRPVSPASAVANATPLPVHANAPRSERLARPTRTAAADSVAKTWDRAQAAAPAYRTTTAMRARATWTAARGRATCFRVSRVGSAEPVFRRVSLARVLPRPTAATGSARRSAHMDRFVSPVCRRDGTAPPTRNAAVDSRVKTDWVSPSVTRRPSRHGLSASASMKTR